ncbi:MAG: hypothetical protein MRJ65_13210 [Candidatus Brocadiaceae bacterium]|nr:hypothetical protein [Candidatus Brocadiaceae bacterium]
MKNQTLWLKKWWLISIFLIISGISILYQFVKPGVENQEHTIHNKEIEALPRHETTSIEHLEEARKALADDFRLNADPMKTSWGRVYDARVHLEAIIQNVSSEYGEAERLMKEVERREIEMERIYEIHTQKHLKKQRDELIEKLDKYFLGKGMDVSIRLEGKEKDILVLGSILWSRPLIYRTVNGTGFLESLKRLGFKKVTYDATHGYSWTFQLEENYEE